MESREISDAQISASSHWFYHAARQGRLNFKQQGMKQGGWSPRTNDLNQWLQVDIGSYTTVTGIATQGRNSVRWPQWVTKFKLQYSVDGVIFQFYMEPGNNAAKVCLKNPKMSPFRWNYLRYKNILGLYIWKVYVSENCNVHFICIPIPILLVRNPRTVS